MLVFRCELPHPVVKLYLSVTQVLIEKKLTVFLYDTDSINFSWLANETQDNTSMCLLKDSVS